MTSRWQCTNQGPPVQWGLGKIRTPVQHGFKQGPQFPILHRWSTLMILPASREMKVGLRKGKVLQDTFRFWGMGGNAIDQTQIRSRICSDRKPCSNTYLAA